MKVLVADDSGMYRGMLKRLIEGWGYEVVLAANGCEAQEILDSDDGPRLAVLDCFMPGLGGFELCELIRARPQGYVYTLLLSVADQQADVLRGFELGADDYLCKPFEALELKARLKAGERIIRCHEELVAMREALRFGASHDPLLRIWNRTAIIDLLTTEVGRAKRMQSSLCIIFADLDCFKQVNDTHGHLVGDDVLRRVAEKLSSAVREYDYVGRYGGDEFLIVLPSCPAEAAREIAERVRLHIGKDPISIAPLKVKITASIGVTEWRPGEDVSDLIHRADVAMYHAKQQGRDRVEVETPAETEASAATDGAAAATDFTASDRVTGFDQLR
jgi:two-component system chemotaxis response regulator CheY